MTECTRPLIGEPTANYEAFRTAFRTNLCYNNPKLITAVCDWRNVGIPRGSTWIITAVRLGEVFGGSLNRPSTFFCL